MFAFFWRWFGWDGAAAGGVPPHIDNRSTPGADGRDRGVVGAGGQNRSVTGRPLPS